MARFTNIGMPRKTFVQSAAEEARAEKPEKAEEAAAEAGPSDGGKRKGWGRDPEIASECRRHSCLCSLAWPC